MTASTRRHVDEEGRKPASLGRYEDGRSYELPAGWEPLELEVLERAVGQTRLALMDTEEFGAPALQRMKAYYDPEGGFAGNLFTSAAPNDELAVGAADLWAVGTLSMQRYVTPPVGRRLLGPGPAHNNVSRQLHRLPSDLPITDLRADVLVAMEELYTTLRRLLATDDHDSNRWVFAAKLCARKRPKLMPVRDNKVCQLLSAGHGLGTRPGQLGQFQRDIQVFAYLMTTRDIRSSLDNLFHELMSSEVAGHVEVEDLRLLDVALWTAAMQVEQPPSAVI